MQDSASQNLAFFVKYIIIQSANISSGYDDIEDHLFNPDSGIIRN